MNDDADDYEMGRIKRVESKWSSRFARYDDLIVMIFVMIFSLVVMMLC